MKTVVVGTVAFDAIETPFGKTDKIVGGSASYIGLSASYFTNEIGIVSVVGDDFPAETIAKFNEKGIDTAGLEIKEGEKSFFWSGKYHMDMNSRDTLVTDLNVLADFDPKLPEAYRNAEYLMLGNIDPKLQIQVIEQMKSRPKLIIMDTMNFWMDIALDTLVKAISMVDVLTINDEEARQLSGEYSLVKAARKVLEMGPKYVIIKKGEHGALIFHEDNVFFAPALPLESVFDPTGAGDTFAGGFLGHIARSNDISFDNMKRAIIFGSGMASFCVEKFGPERLYDLSEKEIDDRIQQFIDLVQFDIQLVG
ncbi:MAG: sugar/nucleoside kinase (ribokinase family) [Limisphaerales bacterium]|jgi:sugar/nucleoside kinase (ribokinase family)